MIAQYGVIAYRRTEEGELRILLITSRDTRRWVIPRGNPITGFAPHQSAAREAFEEAGVLGAAGSTLIGTYPYLKRRGTATPTAVRVDVYPLRVDDELANWPEAHERERRWFAPEAAADVVDEPELKALILAFAAEAPD